jgi:hypothetical protein
MNMDDPNNAEILGKRQQRRADLIAQLTNINATLSLLSANCATMSDQQYEKRRAELINQKADVEQELPTLNAEIKFRNTLKSAADKRAADARKAAGAQAHIDNLQRAVRKGHVRPSELEHARAAPGANLVNLDATATAVRDMLVDYLMPLAVDAPDLNPIPRTTVELADLVIQRAAKADRDAVRIRPEVRAIAEAMEERLKRNEWKGGWDAMSVAALFKRLGQEIAELRRETKKPNAKQNPYMIRHEAADVANFAMMIADVCNALTKP